MKKRLDANLNIANGHESLSNPTSKKNILPVPNNRLFEKMHILSGTSAHFVQKFHSKSAYEKHTFRKSAFV